MHRTLRPFRHALKLRAFAPRKDNDLSVSCPTRKLSCSNLPFGQLSLHPTRQAYSRRTNSSWDEREASVLRARDRALSRSAPSRYTRRSWRGSSARRIAVVESQPVALVAIQTSCATFSPFFHSAKERCADNAYSAPVQGQSAWSAVCRPIESALRPSGQRNSPESPRGGDNGRRTARSAERTRLSGRSPAPVGLAEKPVAVHLVSHDALLRRPSARCETSGNRSVQSWRSVCRPQRRTIPNVGPSTSTSCPAVGDLGRRLQRRGIKKTDESGCVLKRKLVVGLVGAGVVGKAVAVRIERRGVRSASSTAGHISAARRRDLRPEQSRQTRRMNCGIRSIRPPCSPRWSTSQQPKLPGIMCGILPPSLRVVARQAHLALLNFGEQQHDGEGTVVGDVGRLKAAAAQTLPDAEATAFIPPGRFDERRKLRVDGVEKPARMRMR